MEVVVEKFSFAPEIAFVPRGGVPLEGVTIAPLTPPVSGGSPFMAAIFRFAPGGRIPRHAGTIPQIIAVLDGSGEVRGADGVGEPIAAGDALLLSQGEEHEVTSAVGLTALIIEGDRLDRFRDPRAGA